MSERRDMTAGYLSDAYLYTYIHIYIHTCMYVDDKGKGKEGEDKRKKKWPQNERMNLRVASCM